MNILLFFPSDRYVEPGRKGAGERFFISRDDSRWQHLKKVLRAQVGERFFAGIADSRSGQAELLEISESGFLFSFFPGGPDRPLFPLELVVGQVRPICAKRILREAAMLGVSRLVFVGTDLGEKSYREAKLWKSGEAERYLLDGVVQAASCHLPGLELFTDLESYLDSCKTPGIVLDNELDGQPLSTMKPSLPLSLAVGSERGWSVRERGLFSAAHWPAARLGTRILRTETACCAALSLLLL